MRETRKAVVIGLGKSGLAASRFLAAEGYAVVVVDKNRDEQTTASQQKLPAGVTVKLGPYTPGIIDGSDLVSPSPGVPWDAPELQRARDMGIPVASEMELFFQHCQAHIVGVTGTNGKTTTTALVAAMLEAGGKTTHLGGNIGATVLDRLQEFGAEDWVALELSSFQLESTASPACDIAVVLNVTPDHLDRHKTMERYTAIKAKLVEHARSFAVLNRDDALVSAMAAQAHCPSRFFGLTEGPDTYAFIGGGQLKLRSAQGTTDLLDVGEVPLFGEHNLENILAAACAADAAGIKSEEIALAIKNFQPVAHRLQPVLDDRGVLWVDDSKATNADSAIKALRAFSRPIVWIGGGYSKGVPATELAAVVADTSRCALLIGDTANELDAELEKLGFATRYRVETLDRAVERACALAQAGDVVLLAPGYASFDQFRNYEERGDCFRRLVQDLVMSPVQE